MTGGSSSVLGGIDELQLNVEVETFSSSRLVVDDQLLTTSEDLRSPSVELVSPSVETMSPPSELAFQLQSPGSSVGLVSLESSVCLASPSPSLEVLTPPQEEEPTQSQEELASSVSSSKTLVNEQTTKEGLDQRLADAMVEEARQTASDDSSSRSSEVRSALKIPSEMEVAPRHKLLTLITLFTLFLLLKLLYTAILLACLPIYIVRKG